MPKGGNSGGGGGGKGKPGGGDDDGGINQINGNKRDNTLIGTDGNDAILGWVVIDANTVITGAVTKVVRTINNGLSWTEPAVAGTTNVINFAL